MGSDAVTAARAAEPNAAPVAPIWSGRPLTRAERTAVALLIGAAAGLATLLIVLGHPEMGVKDFTNNWRAAVALSHGLNPYEALRTYGTYPYSDPYFYPLTAAVASLPLALLAAPAAVALFVALSSGALAFVLSRDGAWRLWAFLSAPFLMAVSLGQWSPLLTAAALVTPLGWVLACKPTVGAALWLYRPSWRSAALALALVALSFVLVPNWVPGWLGAVARTPHHSAPVLRPFGFLALAALLRWRTREGRLVGAMALVPQVVYFYEQLPLWLVPWNGASAFALTALSWVAFGVMRARCGDAYFCGAQAVEPVIWLVYLPAAVLALVRPGVDAERGWLAAAWARVRGRGSAAGVWTS